MIAHMLNKPSFDYSRRKPSYGRAGGATNAFNRRQKAAPNPLHRKGPCAPAGPRAGTMGTTPLKGVFDGRRKQFMRAAVAPNAFNCNQMRMGPFHIRGSVGSPWGGPCAPGFMASFALEDLFNGLEAPDAQETMGTERARAMPVDFVEDSQGFQIKADIPGVQKKDIKLDVDENVLTISAKRSSDTKVDDAQEVSEKGPEDERNVRRSERFESFQSRSFRVPKTADMSSISAKYDNGVLTVYINKRKDVLEQKRSVKIA